MEEKRAQVIPQTGAGIAEVQAARFAPLKDELLELEKQLVETEAAEPQLQWAIDDLPSEPGGFGWLLLWPLVGLAVLQWRADHVAFFVSVAVWLAAYWTAFKVTEQSMSKSSELRARLTAVQERIHQLEGAGHDEAMLRIAVELNEKKERLEKAKASRAAQEAEFTRRLVDLREREDRRQRAAEAKGEPAYKSEPWRALPGMGLLGLGFLLSHGLAPLASAIAIGLVGTLTATFWGWRSQRLAKAFDQASRVL